MAKYTIEVRKICEIYGRNVVESWFKNYNLSDFLTTAQISAITSANVWTKDKLATKIVDNFYFREIAFETPAMFEHFAKVKMNNIMDKYLLLIYSSSLSLNPLRDINTTHTTSRTVENTNSTEGSSTSESTSNNSNSGLIVNSNTPQGQISKANILNGTYASNTSGNENESETTVNDSTTSSASGESTTTESVSKIETGNRTSEADLILKYRKTILNIDEMILNELKDLFFGLW